MRILCVYNPLSGRGKGERLAKKLSTQLIALGHDVEQRQSQTELSKEHIEKIDNCELLLVVGGDGTLSNYLEICSSRETTIAFFGAGNECLFSQAFNLPRKVEQFAKSLDSMHTCSCCYALANNKAFFHVFSIGLDAEVVRNVAQSRGEKVSNFLYFKCGVRQVFTYKTPKLNVTLDGEEIIKGSKGALLVANHHCYAGGIQPVPGAHCQNKELVIRFYPMMRPRHYLAWAIAYLMGRKVPLRNSREYRGQCVEVDGKRGSLGTQIDGEYLGQLPAKIKLASKSIKVLCAADSGLSD